MTGDRDPTTFDTVALERVVASLVDRVERRFFGKYRARVVDNDDPSGLGRVRVCVPSVLGPDVVTGWASPCSPYGGLANQGMLFVPDNGAGVWVEFEEGDLEFPIWVGTFWTRPGDASEVPLPNGSDGTEASQAQSPPTCKIVKTAKLHTLQLEDADGAERIVLREGTTGCRISLDADGVTVTDDQGNTAALGRRAVRLTDVTGNSLTMTESGVTLTAKSPLTIDAAGQPVRVVGASIALEKG